MATNPVTASSLLIFTIMSFLVFSRSSKAFAANSGSSSGRWGRRILSTGNKMQRLSGSFAPFSAAGSLAFVDKTSTTGGVTPTTRYYNTPLTMLRGGGNTHGTHHDLMDRKPRSNTRSRRPSRRLFSTTGDNDNNNNNNKDAAPPAPPDFTTNLNVSVFAIQGHRDYMEDEYVIAQDFAAVFDGHGGPAVSRYLRQNLFAHLQATLPQVVSQRQQRIIAEEQESSDTGASFAVSSPPLVAATNLEGASALEDTSNTQQHKPSSSSEPTVQDYCIALRMALDKVDQEVQRINHWSYQGSTAVAAWLHHDIADDNPNDKTTTLIVANVGDSRAIHGRNGAVLELSYDHKPDDPKEIERIEAVGGTVVWCGPRDKRTGEPILSAGIYRVNGNLALSRAIGDRSERPAVTAEPDITYTQVLKTVMEEGNANNNDDTDVVEGDTSDQPIKRNREYVVLATDGLWDVFTNQNVVDIVDLLLDKATLSQRPQIAEVLVREALRRGAYDNVTVIIIWLNTGDADDDEGSTQQ